MQYQWPLTRTREMFSRAVGLVRMRNLNHLNLSRELRDPAAVECMVGDVKETRVKDRESRSPQEPLAIACMAIRVHHNTTRVLVIASCAAALRAASHKRGSKMVEVHFVEDFQKGTTRIEFRVNLQSLRTHGSALEGRC